MKTPAPLKNTVKEIILSDNNAFMHTIAAQDCSDNMRIVCPKNSSGDILFEGNVNSIDLVLGSNSSLNFYLVPTVSRSARQNLCATLDQSSTLNFYDINCDDHSLSYDHQINLRGEGAGLNYYGLDLLGENAHKQTELNVFHQAPHTISTQAFRGIYGGHAKGQFFGKVNILKSAPKSAAEQLYRGLVTSVNAEAQVLPQLEIHNSDIKASHGASVGELDHEALFYLCSRGLKVDEAKSLLISSVAQEILHQIADKKIRESLSSKAHAVIRKLSEAYDAH